MKDFFSVLRQYDEAKSNGDRFYIGSECKRGHSGVRYVAGGKCVSCAAQNVREKMAKQSGTSNFSAYDDIHEAKRLKADLADPWDEIAG